MKVSTVDDMIREFRAAEARLKSARTDLGVSKLIAKEGREGPHRVQESDDVYNAHLEVEMASMIATKSKCAVLNALEDRRRAHEDRVSLCNALRGITTRLEVCNGK
jgi:hypothetical protein